jgi:hypothetical protein
MKPEARKPFNFLSTWGTKNSNQTQPSFSAFKLLEIWKRVALLLGWDRIPQENV